MNAKANVQYVDGVGLTRLPAVQPYRLTTLTATGAITEGLTLGRCAQIVILLRITMAPCILAMAGIRPGRTEKLIYDMICMDILARSEKVREAAHWRVRGSVSACVRRRLWMGSRPRPNTRCDTLNRKLPH